MEIIKGIKEAGTKAEHHGYYYKLSNIIEIMILGLLCRMQTMKDIYYWATSKDVKVMLQIYFGIKKIPCYSHFTNLVGLLESDELNKIFMEFFSKLVGSVVGKTVSIDGKTVCSTANMKNYDSPLHIASAFVVENGITIGQLATEAKSNEIPAVRELIKLLDITGATVVADALNCQKKTAKEVIKAGADYVFSVKKNQRNLYDDISEMVDFKINDEIEKRESPMEKIVKIDKGHGRIEKRTAYVSHDVEWLYNRDKWEGLQTIGAIKTAAETRYYISSRKLTAEQLLDITRSEWAVESMHWQLDVLWGEDVTTLHEENTQKTLNILRKTALNILKTYRNNFAPKLNIADIMRKCLHDTDFLLGVLLQFNDYERNVTN